jgi:small subunit ribosomal protein S6e
MKLHLAYPDTGCNKSISVDDENKVRAFYDKRISDEVAMDPLGGQFKGYVVRITGGCDKAGFPMKQGVLTTSRVKLLLPRGTTGFKKWRGKKGERRRKSVRGCIVSPDIAALNLIIVKKGETDIEGLTNATKPRSLGPKRATRIRKLFNLTKKDDVKDYVIKHKVVTKEGTEIMVAPKIQRLLTHSKIKRRRDLEKLKE